MKIDLKITLMSIRASLVPDFFLIVEYLLFSAHRFFVLSVNQTTNFRCLRYCVFRVHALEKRGLPEFFNGKNKSKSPEV